MQEKNGSRERLFRELVTAIVRMGYPQEFGVIIARNLGTEKTMSRMLGYLRNSHPRSAEEIADEMLAIREDRDRWRKNKEAQYYNMKYNELLNYGLPGAEEEDPEDSGADDTDDSDEADSGEN